MSTLQDMSHDPISCDVSNCGACFHYGRGFADGIERLKLQRELQRLRQDSDTLRQQRLQNREEIDNGRSG